MRLLLALPVFMALLPPVRMIAQDDPNDVPLGDVARNLRKKNPPAQQVIDDDNLTQVMEQGEKRQGFGSSLRYLMAGESKGFQVSAPDVTCSLAFTANVKSLLSSTQYDEMNLPPAEVAKLEGPAAIEGDALTVSIFNATNWHVSEVEVAFTLVKKNGGSESSLSGDPLAGVPIAGNQYLGSVAADNPIQQVRPEKKPDLTVIYRMRAAAPPWARAVFSAPLNLELAPGEEWHWAIVQAKGYPPQGQAGAVQQTAAVQTNAPASIQPASITLPAAPQNESPLPVSPDY